MTLTPTSSLEDTLNTYIADEYFAALQYKMAKVVAQGKALDYADSVFEDNEEDEEEHFNEIVTFAQSLKIPVKVNPDEMKNNCTTPYVDVVDGDTTAQLVSILIAAEKSAIKGYTIGLSNETITKEHPELIQFLGEKLNDERTHLKELEDLESNIKADGKVVPQADLDEFDIISNDEITDKINDMMMGNTEDDNKIIITSELPNDCECQNDCSCETVSEPEDCSEKKPCDNECVCLQNIDNFSDASKDQIIDDNTIDGILVTITSKPHDDVVRITKDFINFLPEQKISTFADYAEFFDPTLVIQTSHDDVNQCKCKFIEMIDGDTIDVFDVIRKLIKFVNKNDVIDFSNAIGLIVDKTPPFTGAGFMNNTDNMTFTQLFRSILH